MMKALTISQPFASLIASGVKWVENRRWYTSYRGWLAIHAGKGTQYLDDDELADYPTGCIVAVARLVACVRLDDVVRNAERHAARCGPSGSSRNWCEIRDHAYSEGPFCWVLDDVRQIERVPIRGAQGLWLVPEGLICEHVKGGE